MIRLAVRYPIQEMSSATERRRANGLRLIDESFDTLALDPVFNNRSYFAVAGRKWRVIIGLAWNRKHLVVGPEGAFNTNGPIFRCQEPPRRSAPRNTRTVSKRWQASNVEMGR
jgi:hypothetical protein